MGVEPSMSFGVIISPVEGVGDSTHDILSLPPGLCLVSRLGLHIQALVGADQTELVSSDPNLNLQSPVELWKTSTPGTSPGQKGPLGMLVARQNVTCVHVVGVALGTVRHQLLSSETLSFRCDAEPGTSPSPIPQVGGGHDKCAVKSCPITPESIIKEPRDETASSVSQCRKVRVVMLGQKR